MSQSPTTDGSDTVTYRQGESSLEGFASVIKLSSNESSMGPSPAALQAFRDSAGQLHRYPDGSHRQLRAALARVHGLEEDRIICGNGSDELISLTVRAFVRPGDEALLSENGFLMSNIHCRAQGAQLVIAPESDYHVDVDAMLARVTPRTRFCTIANPNNPTGTYLSRSELRRLHSGLPEDCIFLIDSAYAEYVRRDDYEPGVELVRSADNVIMTRTFSKAYGLSAARVGWAYASPKIIEALNAIRTPFNVNGPALAAAQAAVEDREWTERVVQHNLSSQERIRERLADLPGLRLIPSVTNFYLLHFEGAEGRTATAAERFLRTRGIIPRPSSRGDELLRITVGLDEENDAVLEALTAFMLESGERDA